MKTKNFLSTILLVSISLISFGQYNYFRGGVPPYDDNTYRALNESVNVSPTVTGTTDTMTVVPSCFHNEVSPSDSVLGTVIYIIKNPALSYPGDELEFEGIASKLNTPTIKFRNKYNTVFKFADSISFAKQLGDGTQYTLGGDSTIILQKGKYYDIKFKYIGGYWSQVSRAVRGHFTYTTWDIYYDPRNVHSDRWKELNAPLN